MNAPAPIPQRLDPSTLDALAAGHLTDKEWPEPEPLPPRGDMGEGKPFPLSLLPAALQDAVREVARFNKIPPASPALVGIGALATAIGKRALVIERGGFVHHPALFLVAIGGSGERKSQAFRAMAEPLEQWAVEQTAEWELAVARAQSRNAAVDSEIAKLKRRKNLDLHQTAQEIQRMNAERLPIPPRPRLFTTDCTEERIFQMMHERQGAFAVMSGEGRPVLDAILGKYSGDNRTGDAVYLAGISGDSISRDRVGGSRDGGPEERVIRRPCLNVCVLVQPDKYLEIAAHPVLRASGALARIWPAWLPSVAGQQQEQVGESALDTRQFAGYTKQVLALLAHSPVQGATGELVPHQARLGPEAVVARVAVHNALQDRMADTCDLADVRDIAAKAVSQMCKLALVLHLAAQPEVLREPVSEIDGDIWAAAHCIGLWFLEEAVRVQRAAVEDPLIEAARRTLAWLGRQQETVISRRTLSLYGPRPRPDARMAGAVLDLLADLGWVQSVPAGKRQSQYLLHPSLRHPGPRRSVIPQ